MASHTSQVRPCPGWRATRCLLSGFPGTFRAAVETFAWEHPGGQVAAAYVAADAEAHFDAVPRDRTTPGGTPPAGTSSASAPSRSPPARPELRRRTEVGCSIRTLSAKLARAADNFLAVHASSAALAHAARRLGNLPAARTRRLTDSADSAGRAGSTSVSQSPRSAAPHPRRAVPAVRGGVRSVPAAPAGASPCASVASSDSGCKLTATPSTPPARRQLGLGRHEALPDKLQRPGGPRSRPATGPEGGQHIARDQKTESPAPALPLPYEHSIDKMAIINPRTTRPSISTGPCIRCSTPRHAAPGARQLDRPGDHHARQFRDGCAGIRTATRRRTSASARVEVRTAAPEPAGGRRPGTSMGPTQRSHPGEQSDTAALGPPNVDEPDSN